MIYPETDIAEADRLMQTFPAPVIFFLNGTVRAGREQWTCRVKSQETWDDNVITWVEAEETTAPGPVQAVQNAQKLLKIRLSS